MGQKKEGFQLSLSALGIEPDGCGLQVEGLYCKDAGEAVWCGLFGFCGCGNWKDHLDVLLNTLRKIERWHTMDEEQEYTPEEELWLYFLDLHDFTEHGSSIFGSWFSDKGKHLKCVLEVWNKNRMKK